MTAVGGGCPSCSGPQRETVDMICPACGTDYAPTNPRFPRLPADSQLHVCLDCGAVVAEKAIGFHDTWHDNISRAATDALSRETR